MGVRECYWECVLGAEKSLEWEDSVTRKPFWATLFGFNSCLFVTQVFHKICLVMV